MSRLSVVVLLFSCVGIVCCKKPEENKEISLELAAGFLPFVCVGTCMIVLVCYKCCHHKEVVSTRRIPAVAIIDIPENTTCPNCAGTLFDCPMAKDSIYMYSHPPPAYQPPPEYCTLVFDEIPTLQQSFPVAVHIPSVDRPK